MRIRDLVVRSGALGIIALVSVSGPLAADPDTSCGGPNLGLWYCEGCYYDFSAADWYLDYWECFLEVGWMEMGEIHFESMSDCEQALEEDCEIGDPFEN